MTTGGTDRGARIAQQQHAADMIRARTLIVLACTIWLVMGLALDVVVHPAIGTGSLAFVVIVRLATTVFHVAIIAALFRRPLLPPRIANLLAASVFPVTAFALMLIATHMGGLVSPYVSALFVIVMGQAVATPAPWQRGLPVTLLSTLVYPIGLVVATRFDPALAAQLSDHSAVVAFATYLAVIAAAAFLGVWGGHVIWALRQSVFESRKLGRYRLLRRIGKGGMGEVWRAEDRALRRHVALKILSPEHGRNPARIARFEREIQATAAVVHTNIVRLHDWGVTDDGVWYYAMDLLDGADLATTVDRCGPLPAALALQLFVPAARGLAEAHRVGIVHRDLKPANLFVVASADHEPQRIELLDFGIAEVGDDDAELTQAGAVLGTPGFMAPEVIAGAPGGVPGDVYGLAAALYFAITGKSPRDARGAPASALVDGIPAALDDALVRALDADPARRPASAEDFASQLAAAKLAWAGSFRIDQVHSIPPPAPDPSLDPEAAPTRVDAPRIAR
ncbi:MAG TPA: serine/threonine-protein kinase [Kofleriaceae bacterium]|nr:serine/threonine-protein kinase [Kofleriaceae bacterium]